MRAGGSTRAHRTTRVLDEAQGVRAMTWVMAIMLFLTVLAAALGLATRSATASLASELAGRMTVQIAEPDPARRDTQAAAAVAALRATPGVRRVAPVDRAALAALLQPWLGAAGSDPDLPVPAIIDVDLAATTPADIARVRAAVTRVAPGARIDAQEAWMSPVSAFLRLVGWLALALVLLMAGATAAVVALAARAGLDAHRATIEVMHMLGSTDVQVARLFQRRIARDAAIGGAIGGAAALAVIALVGARAAALGSALIGGAALGIGGWIALALIPIGFVALAAAAARIAVTRALEDIL